MRELSVNRMDLQAPNLAGPPWTNLGAGTPSCTTPQQPTIFVKGPIYLSQKLATELQIF